ncbi:MAG TPA: DUF2062 domain-containing protein [Campylobacterales bacterium]|nr:DUF2062 domain-containing protein [Campylobacterales bacterium]HHS92641.1 DUF2062 domain-containing protein [Campylobacterales bacterium]
MIRKVFKQQQTSTKIKELIKKYKIPREYLSTNRKSIAKGALIGLFWAFIPMPLQMAAVIAMTPFVKFNVPLAFTMVWLSNPLTMPFMYYMEYKTGNYILGTTGINEIELTLEWFSNHWDTIILPLYIGTIPYSLGVSILVYFLINKTWINSVKNEQYNKNKRGIKK